LGDFFSGDLVLKFSSLRYSNGVVTGLGESQDVGMSRAAALDADSTSGLRKES
jgi:hypothetical protein